MVKYTILFIINFSESDNIPNNVSRAILNKPTNEKEHNRDLFVFNMKNTVRQYVHIKYNSFSQQINNVYIICGGKVAKVFTEYESTVIKTVDLYENQNWLVFAIKHDDFLVSHECAMKYFESQASFRFSFNKNNFPPKVITESLTHLYTGKIPAQDIQTDRKNIIPKRRQFAVLNESNSDKKLKKIQFKSSNNLNLDHQQACEAYDTIIELANDGNRVSSNESELENTNVSIDKTKTSSKTIYLDGKSLFYDEKFFKGTIKNPSTRCNNIAVIVDVSNFYNKEMQKYFIPVVLRIPRLYHLPIQDLHDLNIKHVYVQSENKANSLFTTEIKIGPIPVTESNVRIDYKDVFLINPHDITAVAEFLLTESVVFKLTCDPIVQTTDAATSYGKHVADMIMRKIQPSKFSTHQKYPLSLYDSYGFGGGSHPHGIRLTANKSNATIIGRVAFDLSALVHRDQHVNIIRAFTGNQTFLQQVPTFNEYVFNEHKLQGFQISIELRVNSGSQLNIGLDWNDGLFLQRYMNRAVIMYQQEYAGELMDLYKELIKHNKEILSLKNKKSRKTLSFEKHDFFSGYIVDCVEFTIMFVEGFHNSLRLKLGRNFIRHEPTMMLYDRMMIFSKVLYDAFYDFGGFYRITMNKPLEAFLRDATLYCKGNGHATAAKRGLLKLDLTRKCQNIREFCDSNLEITPEELQNLDYEYNSVD